MPEEPGRRGHGGGGRARRRDEPRDAPNRQRRAVPRREAPRGRGPNHEGRTSRLWIWFEQPRKLGQRGLAERAGDGTRERDDDATRGDERDDASARQGEAAVGQDRFPGTRERRRGREPNWSPRHRGCVAVGGGGSAARSARKFRPTSLARARARADSRRSRLRPTRSAPQQAPPSFLRRPRAGSKASTRICGDQVRGLVVTTMRPPRLRPLVRAVRTTDTPRCTVRWMSASASAARTPSGLDAPGLPSTFVPGFHDERLVRQMPFRRLGRHRVASVISLGTSAFGGVFGPVQADECVRLTHAALRAGVNVIDSGAFARDGRRSVSRLAAPRPPRALPRSNPRSLAFSQSLQRRGTGTGRASA